MDRKKRFFNRVLLVIGASAVLTFAGYLFFTKRTPRHYILPKDLKGWVTIRYEKKNAQPLPIEDGAYVLRIPNDGLLDTSTPLESGWARDEFFWETDGRLEEIPRQVEANGVNCKFIHDREDKEMNYEPIWQALPDQADTILWDGAKISKRGRKVDVRTGKKVLEHFWVSREPQPFFHSHDTLPAERKVW